MPVIRIVIDMDLAKRIATLRKEHGLTQQALAEALGLHVTQIKRYESGASAPSIEALKKLSKTFCVTTDSLLFDEDELSPDADLALQFKAISSMSDEERFVIKQLLQGMIIKYSADKWSDEIR